MLSLRKIMQSEIFNNSRLKRDLITTTNMIPFSPKLDFEGVKVLDGFRCWPSFFGVFPSPPAFMSISHARVFSSTFSSSDRRGSTGRRSRRPNAFR